MSEAPHRTYGLRWANAHSGRHLPTPSDNLVDFDILSDLRDFPDDDDLADSDTRQTGPHGTDIGPGPQHPVRWPLL